MVDFPLFSTSFLWDDCNWESHCKVLIYNFIHHGGRIIVYSALTTPEPLCCGTPLVYHALCKIKKELDPKRSPLRCNQTSSLQRKGLTVCLTGIYHKYHSREGLSIGWESFWVRVEFYQETNFEGLIGRLISFAVDVTVIGETICFRQWIIIDMKQTWWTIAFQEKDQILLYFSSQFINLYLFPSLWLITLRFSS